MVARRWVLGALAGLSTVPLAGCNGPFGSGGGTDTPSVALISPAFEAGGAIPTRYACDGGGISPPLAVGSVPDAAETLALVMDDPTADGYVHWLLWNVPAVTREIPADIPSTDRVETLGDAPQGRNSAGSIGYTPCCPPPADGPHTYRFRLYAVDSRLEVTAGERKDALLEAVRPATLALTTLTGHYDR